MRLRKDSFRFSEECGKIWVKEIVPKYPELERKTVDIEVWDEKSWSKAKELKIIKPEYDYHADLVTLIVYPKKLKLSKLGPDVPDVDALIVFNDEDTFWRKASREEISEMLSHEALRIINRKSKDDISFILDCIKRGVPLDHHDKAILMEWGVKRAEQKLPIDPKIKEVLVSCAIEAIQNGGKVRL